MLFTQFSKKSHKGFRTLHTNDSTIWYHSRFQRLFGFQYFAKMKTIENIHILPVIIIIKNVIFKVRLGSNKCHLTYL